MFDKDYRVATWMCAFIAVAQQMAGCNIVNMYSTIIFEGIASQSDSVPLTPTACSYFIGCSGFVGAIFAAFTCLYFTRRTVFIGGHVSMGIANIVCGVCVNQHNEIGALLGMCVMVISFQASSGAMFWVYATETIVDASIGFCVFIMMGFLFVQSVVSIGIMNAIGIDVFFYILGGFQVLTCTVLFFFMKETKGLSGAEKKALYKPKNN